MSHFLFQTDRWFYCFQCFNYFSLGHLHAFGTFLESILETDELAEYYYYYYYLN